MTKERIEQIKNKYQEDRLNLTIMVIILNINGLNIPKKKQKRQGNWSGYSDIRQNGYQSKEYYQ